MALTFQVGIAMNVVDFTALDPNMHALMLHVDAQRPRDFSEHVRFGAEYTFMNIISIRGGFEQLAASEEQGVSLGAGLQYELSSFKIGADYAYTDFGIFGSLSRIAVKVGM